MEQKKVCVLSAFLIAFLFTISVSFAQDQARSQQDEAGMAAESAVMDVQREGAQNTGTAVTPQEQAQWLYGDVISVDAPKNTLTVKYLDYDADQEKEIAITVDSQTTYENVKFLLEVKPKDTVSIDYALGDGGKNIAKNISVETPGGDETVMPEAKAEDVKPAGIACAAPEAAAEK